MPTLILRNEGGDEVETLDLEKWDTDTIIEYLTRHLNNEVQGEEINNEEL